MTTQPYPLCSTLRQVCPARSTDSFPVAPMRKLRLGEVESHASRSDPQLARGQHHATTPQEQPYLLPHLLPTPSLKQAFRQAGAHGTHPQAQTGDQ